MPRAAPVAPTGPPDGLGPGEEMQAGQPSLGGRSRWWSLVPRSPKKETRGTTTQDRAGRVQTCTLQTHRDTHARETNTPRTPAHAPQRLPQETTYSPHVKIQTGAHPSVQGAGSPSPVAQKQADKPESPHSMLRSQEPQSPPQACPAGAPCTPSQAGGARGWPGADLTPVESGNQPRTAHSLKVTAQQAARQPWGQEQTLGRQHGTATW